MHEQRMRGFRPLTLAILMAFTLAMGVMGSAHATPSVSDPALEAYLLSGGSMDDLCPAGHHDGMAMHDCPVCHLAGTVLPTSTPQISFHPELLVLTLRAAVPPNVVRKTTDPAHFARGPPEQV
ncbi:hypothetical protein [Falsirhodobacter sp. alg1]|uniref:hypothetical protein n=1 Tax=Falsirhodobacter sp. alg1 TaxID=1472418 RepID=UPI0005F085F8|nr:hypothetical protein [Falsirhodobacter sp. alg1]